MAGSVSIFNYITDKLIFAVMALIVFLIVGVYGGFVKLAEIGATIKIIPTWIYILFGVLVLFRMLKK